MDSGATASTASRRSACSVLARANGTTIRLAAQLDSLPARTAASAASGNADSSCQAPADPAHVAPATARQFVLRQALTLHQLTQQQGFLDAGERAILRARQHAEQRFG